MNRNTIYESDIEEASLNWFAELGYTILHGPNIAPDTPNAERSTYKEVVLTNRLQDAIARLNPNIPTDAQEEAIRKVLHPDSPALVQNNRTFHQMLVDGIEVEYWQPDGTIRGERVRLIDFDTPDNNNWLAVNQFTIVETSERRPDIVLFINGLPLAIIELKNPTDEKATFLTAFRQIQTYKHEIRSLFTYNEAIVVSDGLEARIGSLTADTEWFLPWRTIEGEDEAPSTEVALEVLIKGGFEKNRFLRYLKHFIVFEENESGTVAKKIAGYHQFHAVKKAVDTTVQASSPAGDKQCGVIWHTQGSGKSLTMAFYAGTIVQHPQMENPTLVIITDQNDLDNQMFGTFARCHQLLRQTPEQAKNRKHSVRSVLAKPSAAKETQTETTEQAIKQLVSKAVVSEGVVDIFTAAGLEKPEVSILSDEFLAEVRDLPHKNVAVELLERLLNDDIRTRSQKNVVQGRSFASMLERSIRTYQNRAIEAAQVIEELIEIAREMRQAQDRGDDLGLSDEELAFYDALEVNDNAVQVLGDETLRTITVELVETVQRNVSIDWAIKESSRANIRRLVKRTLRKYGYPPNKQERAAETVLEQAEVLCENWVI